MNITIKKDHETEECYIDLNDLKDYFNDISIVEYYELEELDNGDFSLKFFDRSHQLVKPKEIL